MKALNEKERNEKYYQFISLYFLSVVVIIFAVLFNQSVYKKDYKLTKQKLKVYESGSANPDDILSVCKTIDNDLAKIDSSSSSVDVGLNEQKIVKNISKLEESVRDSTLPSKLLLDLTIAYADLLKAKKSFINCMETRQGNDVNIQELIEQRDELKAKLKEANAGLRANGYPVVN